MKLFCLELFLTWWWRLYCSKYKIIKLPIDLLRVINLFLTFDCPILNQGSVSLVTTSIVGSNINSFLIESRRKYLKPKKILLFGNKNILETKKVYFSGNKKVVSYNGPYELFISVDKQKQIPFPYPTPGIPFFNFMVTTTPALIYDSIVGDNGIHVTYHRTSEGINYYGIGLFTHKSHDYQCLDTTQDIDYYHKGTEKKWKNKFSRNCDYIIQYEKHPMELRYFWSNNCIGVTCNSKELSCGIYYCKPAYPCLYVFPCFKEFSLIVGIRKYQALECDYNLSKKIFN